MRRIDWWLGVSALVLALLFHAFWPRYEFTIKPDWPVRVFRADRWTGRVEVIVPDVPSAVKPPAVDLSSPKDPLVFDAFEDYENSKPKPDP